MFSEFKMVVFENDKIVETYTKESPTQPAQFAKSLQDFRIAVNTSLTNIIKNRSDSSPEDEDKGENMDGESESDENEEMHSVTNPKKRKK